MRSLAKQLAVAFLALGMCSAAQAQFNRLVIFGESTSETYNTLLLTDQLGVEFDLGTWDGDPTTLPTEPVSGLYFAGRWSNGPIWVDYLAGSLFLPSPCPSLGPVPAAGCFAAGDNYAITDATLGKGNDERYSVWTGEVLAPPRVASLGKQIGAFERSGDTLAANDLVIVWSGANDLFFARSAKDAIKAILRLRAHIQSLVDLGARHIIVPNQADASGAPFFASLTQQQRDDLSALTNGFNFALALVLTNLSEQYGGAVTLYTPDFATAGKTLFACPQLLQAYVSAAGLPLTIPTNSTHSAILAGAANPNDYVFWDTIHPTTATHALLALIAGSALSGGPPLPTCDELEVIFGG